MKLLKEPFILFLLIVTICTIDESEGRRREKESDEDESKKAHSHHRGRKHEEKDQGSQNQTDSGSSDCQDERHFPFIMPNVEANRTDGGPEGEEDSKDVDTTSDNIQEIRINKYYAVRRDRFYIRNTGSSLEFRLQLESGTDARIRGPSWNDEYIFAKGVFHWQLKNLTVKNPDGTTVFNTDSRDPPLEMELVHYGSKHGSLEAAAKVSNGVLVTGHLFELVGRDNPALEPIARSALSTTFPNDDFKQVHGPLDIKLLFPSELSYTEYISMYPLSPCANNAKYLVFKKPLFVSARQLKRFGSLRTEDGLKISDRLGSQDRQASAIAGEPKSSSNTIYLSVVDRHSLPSSAESIHLDIQATAQQYANKMILRSVIVGITARVLIYSLKCHIFFLV